jgi:hypothetical protein
MQTGKGTEHHCGKAWVVALLRLIGQIFSNEDLDELARKVATVPMMVVRSELSKQ